MNKRICTFVGTLMMVFCLCFSSYASGYGVWMKAADGRLWFINLDNFSYLANSWEIIDGKCYAFDQNGYLITNMDLGEGLVIGADGVTTKNGIIVIPPQEQIEKTGINSLDASHTLQSGAGTWIKYPDGKWVHLNTDLSYTTNNWQMIDGKWYYFDANGFMLTNTTTPDGYSVGADGARIDNSNPYTDSQSSMSSSGNTSSSANVSFSPKVKDISNTYDIWTETAKFTKNSNGTYSMKVNSEDLKKKQLNVQNVKIVGYDSNGTQTFSTVEQVYFSKTDGIVNTHRIQCSGIPANTTMITIQDFY